jgi:hypothetical protein
MKICGNCKVEVEETDARCPLCGNLLGEGVPEHSAVEKEALEPQVSESKARRWLWEVISLLALTAAGLLLAIDLADGFRLTWSLYPVSVVAFLWLCATSAVFLGRRPPMLCAALTAAVLAFLFVLELATKGRRWFLPLALPLVVVAIAAVAGTWAVASRLRLPLFPAIAAAVLACGIAAVGVEVVLNRYLQLDRVVSWSFVALACAISLFFALLLTHKRLKERHSDIRRFFHL